MANFLQMVQGHLGPESITRIASLVGQSPGATSSAIGKAVPALTGGLIQKSSSSEGAEEISRHLDHVDDRLLDDIPGFLSSNTSEVMRSGTGMLSGIFGGGLNGVLSKLTPSLGMGEAGSGTLMKLLSPIVLATLARHKRRNNLDARGVASFLSDQRTSVESALPGGLGSFFSWGKGAVAGATTAGAGAVAAARRGVHDVGQTARRDVRDVPEVHTEHHHRGGGMKWVVPALGVAAVGALAYGLLKNRDAGPTVSSVDTQVQGERGEAGYDMEGKTEEELSLSQPPPAPEFDAPEAPEPPDLGVTEEVDETAEEVDESTDEMSAEVGAETGAATPPPSPEASPSEEEEDDGSGAGVAAGAAAGAATGAAAGAALSSDRDAGSSGEEVIVEEEVTTEGADGFEEEDLTYAEESPGFEDQDPLYLGTLFQAGQSDLSTDTDARMESLLELVEGNADQDVEIRGYSYGADTPRTRLLAQERADEVRTWLVDHGVDEERITATSGGPSSRAQIDVFLR